MKARNLNMSKFCQIANAYTNCTEHCDGCLEGDEKEQTPQNDLLEDLMLEQAEQG